MQSWYMFRKILLDWPLGTLIRAIQHVIHCSFHILHPRPVHLLNSLFLYFLHNMLSSHMYPKNLEWTQVVTYSIVCRNIRWHKFILESWYLSASWCTHQVTIFLISSNFWFHTLSYPSFVTCQIRIMFFQGGTKLIKLEGGSSEGPLVIGNLNWRQTAFARSRILWLKPQRLFYES